MTAKALTLSGEAIAVLRNAAFTADSIKLTESLERALYAKVNKALEAVGGKWNRKRQAHIFQQNPRELFDLDARTLEITKVSIDGIKAALKIGGQALCVPQFFPTPAHQPSAWLN